MEIKFELPSFESQVDEAYKILNNNTKSCKNLVLPELIINIETTRLHWKNVKEFLQFINRNPDHFMKWLKSELPSHTIDWVSNSKSDGLIIQGKRQKKADIIDIVLKYVNIYVICASCKQVNTKMNKLNHKQYEFECLKCGMKKFMI